MGQANHDTKTLQSQSTVSLPQQVLRGSLSGTVAVCASHPIELVKARLQVQGEFKTKGSYTEHYRGVFSIFTDLKTVYRADGFGGLYKGIVSGVAYQCILNGSRLGLDAFLKQYYDPKEQPLLRLGIAAGAGGLANYMANPFYVIKTQLQISSNLDVGYQHKRPRLTAAMFFKSYLPSNPVVKAGFIRTSVGSSVQLCSFDIIKHQISRRRPSNSTHSDLLTVSLPASIITVIPLVTLFAPFDLLYTRVCNQPEAQRQAVSTVIRKTWEAERLAGFYKGAVAVGVRLGMQSTICLFMMDFFIKYL